MTSPVIIAFAAVQLPEDPAVIATAPQPGLTGYPALQDTSLSATADGWKHRDVPDNASNFVLVRAMRRPDSVTRAFDFAKSRVAQFRWRSHYPLYDRPDRKHGSINPHGRSFFSDVNRLIDIFGSTRWRALLPSYVFDPEEHAFKSTPINDWHLVQSGHDFESTVDFGKFARYLSATEDPCDVVIEIRHPAREEQEGPIARRWREFVSEYFANAAIPFAMENRRPLLESETYRPYVEAHRELLRLQSR